MYSNILKGGKNIRVRFNSKNGGIRFVNNNGIKIIRILILDSDRN